LAFAVRRIQPCQQSPFPTCCLSPQDLSTCIFAVRFASPQLPRWNEPEPRYLLMLFAINQLQLTHLRIHSSKCPQTSVMPPFVERSHIAIETTVYESSSSASREADISTSQTGPRITNHSRPHRPLNRPGIRTSPSRFSHQSPQPHNHPRTLKVPRYPQSVQSQATRRNEPHHPSINHEPKTPSYATPHRQTNKQTQPLPPSLSHLTATTNRRSHQLPSQRKGASLFLTHLLTHSLTHSGVCIHHYYYYSHCFT